MKRTTLIVALAVIGSAATAIAAISPAGNHSTRPANITVVAKNEAFPVLGAIEVDECQVEDCSDE